MKEDIEIDAFQATELEAQKAAVAFELKTLIRLNEQRKIKRFRGKLKWDGDLNAMRSL